MIDNIVKNGKFNGYHFLKKYFYFLNSQILSYNNFKIKLKLK